MILVINAGSSSIRVALFSRGLEPGLSGHASGIGTQAGALTLGAARRTLPLPDHGSALGALIDTLVAQGVALSSLDGAAHRVVHGGATLTAPAPITPSVLSRIAACVPLAPLHNPHGLAAIETLRDLAPGLPQFASFDTAFHAANPDVATRYALPSEWAAAGLRRYGFHGISYAALVDALPGLSGARLPGRLLAFHLGNGASICAVRDGRSVATTMGYSPLDGLTMGTRSGGIDGNAVLRLVEEIGVDRTRTLLNSESGLLGLSGQSPDMSKLLDDPDPDSAFAVAHFCYWAARHAGSMIAAMEGLDAIAFTGGIGENAARVRARIIGALGWTGARMDPAANRHGGPRLHAAGSPVPAWVVPAREERRIAKDALALLGAPK